MTGVGLAADLTVSFDKIFTIVECWILCPLLTMVLTYVIYRFTRGIMRRLGWTRRGDKVLTGLVLITAAYGAYSLGANNLGNAIGPIAALEHQPIDMRILTVAGAVSIALGALIFGRGVSETVGKNIITLDLQSAFAVQVSAAFGLHLFSMIGIPVSTSQAVVGALLGVGLVHGIKTVSKRKIGEVVVGWIAAPTCSGVVAYIIYSMLVRVV